MRRLLRIIAVVGVLARLALAAWEDHQQPGPLAVGRALAVIGAALVAAALLQRREAAAALRNADVLVPIALALIVEGFLSQWVALWPAVDEGISIGPRVAGHELSPASAVVSIAADVDA